MNYLLQGFLLGLAYVAPIGTQNMFVINTALTRPRKMVWITAFIVFFFDISLAAICFFGAGAIISSNPILEMIIVGIGALVVIYIGISLVRSKDTMESTEEITIPITKIITTACVVTWFNPQAIIDGSMLLGTYRATLPGDAGIFFIIGVCLASGIWWFGMSTIVNLVRAKINDKILRIINIVCGIVIIFYGCKLGVQFIDFFKEIVLS
ncbi:MAG: LysE family transporter [Clostridia bacterium]|nr:LysE family transporter [Clostridia bacterium]